LELILIPHQDVNDPTWSVIILLCCGLAFTLYCVIYILRLSFKELEEDGQVREQGQEGHCEQQEAESGQRNSKEG
jgi:flagellar biosynthesis/type III secretory pathway M-ring protein FliF/YscJ